MFDKSFKSVIGDDIVFMKNMLGLCYSNFFPITTIVSLLIVVIEDYY